MRQMQNKREKDKRSIAGDIEISSENEDDNNDNYDDSE